MAIIRLKISLTKRYKKMKICKKCKKKQLISEFYYFKQDMKYLLLALVFCLVSQVAYAWTDEAIANAIYKAEGGKRACVPYGILSVKVKDEAEARRVCINTIRNNKRRYADYGHRQYKTYLSFLASRYAPLGVSNDPSNLNVNWLKNVMYFLRKGE